MLISSPEGAAASADFAAVAFAGASSGRSPLPPANDAYENDRVRHLLFGTPRTVQSTIQRLHKLGYAEPNDWSRPMATGRVGEVMAILTKRISAD